jgi:enamine deaminase RidA (YjgF/YER057c/UK114 family)
MTSPSNSPASPHKALLPDGWPRPKGYANGVLARGGLIFVAGQIGWNEREEMAEGFIPQLRQALRNVVAVLAEAGAGPQHIVRMTWFVVDIDEYQGALRAVGQIYREEFGAIYPAMALVQVVRLVELGARLEIEATAVLPDA